VTARWRGRIVNIHPALLPKFGGAGMYGRRVHEAVIAAGETESGATVHQVDDAYDRGAIIAQESVPVEPGDTPDSLAARVLTAEHRLYPRTLHALALKLTAELAISR
jgi:phosphoribosylglycinamide formyltransferase-1